MAAEKPSSDARRARLARALKANIARRKAQARAQARTPAVTRDGTRIEVFANTGSVKDALAAVENGAEGSGLLRTEFLFLERDTPPDEDEQLRQHQAIADALQGRPLIVRTLDVGGDKAAPYLPIPAEENPALGLRGVRVSLWRPQLLKTQLRAILRTRPLGPCRIMVPMVADLDELRAVRAVLDEARRELEIVKARRPKASDELAKEVVLFVQSLRGGDLYKAPGVAETLDWVTALHELDSLSLDPQTVNDTLGVLLKYQDDISRMQGTEAKRILDQIKDEIRTMSHT